MAIEDSSTLQASLKTSLILDSGTGNPTFTRAGTITVTNSEGNTETIPANVAAFEGARLVVNQAGVTDSEDVTTGWSSPGTATSTNDVVLESSTGNHYIRPPRSEPMTAGRRYLTHYRVEYVDHQFVQIAFAGSTGNGSDYVNFDIVNGTMSAAGDAKGSITNVSGNIYDLYATFEAVNTTTDSGLFSFVTSLAAGRLQTFTGDGTSSYTFIRYMKTDITDYDVDATSQDYVSIGVLSSPFHGAGLDGYKWFDTDMSGASISDANLKGLRGGTLTYQNTSNISDTAGAIAAVIESDDWGTPDGHIGSSTTGLHLSSANSGVQALDGTNTVNGPTGTPTGQVQMAIGWSGSTLRAAQDTIGTSGSYDGGFGLSNIEIEITGTVRDLNIWTTGLTDAELIEASGGSAEISISVTQAISDSIGQAVTFSKSLPLTQAESDGVAQPLSTGKGLTIDQSLSSGIAQSITHNRSLDLQQAESDGVANTLFFGKDIDLDKSISADLAQQVNHSSSFTVDIAASSGLAQDIGHEKTFTVNLSESEDLAQDVNFDSGVLISSAEADDLGQDVGHEKTFTVNLSESDDLAQDVNFDSGVLISSAESDVLAQDIIFGKSIITDQAADDNISQDISIGSIVDIDQSQDENIAQIITHEKAVQIAQSIEDVVSQSVSFGVRFSVLQATSEEQAFNVGATKTITISRAESDNIAQIITHEFSSDVGQAQADEIAQAVSMFTEALPIFSSVTIGVSINQVKIGVSL